MRVLQNRSLIAGTCYAIRIHTTSALRIASTNAAHRVGWYGRRTLGQGARTPRTTGLRSARWFGPDDVTGLIHRSYLGSTGIPAKALREGPIVGICNSWSEVVNCNVHLRAVATAVKRGVMAAGGVPLEFPTISLGEALMKPTTMLYRNLMAMDVEESIRAHPFDSVVLLAGCDKTVPAQLMGAISADVPAVMVTGGPSLPGVFRGERVGSGTDLWRLTSEYRAGRMTDDEYAELERSLIPTNGHCAEMGTASTMAAIVEGLGMSLPGSAMIPAPNAQRLLSAERAGECAVELATQQRRPSQVIDERSFANAITLLMAIGGSTNAVIHLLALAGRAGIRLDLAQFDEISQRTPVVVNLQPSGEHFAVDLHEAGGIPAVLRAIEPLLDTTANTITGQPLSAALSAAPPSKAGIVGSLDEPYTAAGGIKVLRGSLAPGGALIKRSAASAELLRHRGPATVFDGIDDMLARIDDPALAVDDQSVLVLRNVGPIGGPGMPEWGQVPIPAKLLKRGVRDLVRVSDARISGTSFGTLVVHAAPESAVGGPLSLVRDGDPILLDVESGRIDLDIPERELASRTGATPPPARTRGYERLYAQHVLQADVGCDFDFLQAVPGEPHRSDPDGLVEGWLEGW
ncbi:MAG: hypothetical protein QOF68_2113 [Gaiellales bacterium]|nr:hypothetical protein [Gaiellales bacterium]